VFYEIEKYEIAPGGLCVTFATLTGKRTVRSDSLLQGRTYELS
jgi:hypothetical protein